jgi:hypothetical protein
VLLVEHGYLCNQPLYGLIDGPRFCNRILQYVTVKDGVLTHVKVAENALVSTRFPTSSIPVIMTMMRESITLVVCEDLSEYAVVWGGISLTPIILTLCNTYSQEALYQLKGFADILVCPIQKRID